MFLSLFSLFHLSFGFCTPSINKKKKKTSKQAKQTNKSKQKWTKTKIETKTEETSKTNWRSWRGRLSSFAIGLHHTGPHTWHWLTVESFSKFPFFPLEYYSRKFNCSIILTCFVLVKQKDLLCCVLQQKIHYSRCIFSTQLV